MQLRHRQTHILVDVEARIAAMHAFCAGSASKGFIFGVFAR